MRNRKQKKLSRLDRMEKMIEQLIKSQMRTDQEIKELKEENRKVSAEVARVSKEVERVSKEVERVSKEVERVSKEVERVSKEVETLSKEVRKTSQELRSFKESVKGITDGWGRFLEGLVEPSFIKFLKDNGYRIFEVYRRAVFSKDGKNKEYDLIVVCDKNSIFLVSVKTFVSSESVRDLLEDMEEFFFFSERHKGNNLYAAIAGMNYGEGADVFAIRSGLYVMKVSGEVMKVQTPKNIRVVTS